MAPIQAYHRPQTIAEALAAAGAATACARRSLPAAQPSSPELEEQEIEEVVDLQEAGPTHVEVRGERLALGAFARLQTLVEDERVPSLLRDAAFREGPNTFRYQSNAWWSYRQPPTGKASCSLPCLCTMPASP
jgi:CO/xanthine dehydrogenase FAD-binding subunit